MKVSILSIYKNKINNLTGYEAALLEKLNVRSASQEIPCFSLMPEVH
jgi:hypothetical protein